MRKSSVPCVFPTCLENHRCHVPITLHYLPWLPPVSLAHFLTLLAMVTTSRPIISPFPYTTRHGYHQSHWPISLHYLPMPWLPPVSLAHFLTLLANAMVTTSLIRPFPYTTCHGYHQSHLPISLVPAMVTTSIIDPFPYITCQCHGYHQYHWPISLHYLPWLPPVSLTHFLTLLANAMVTTRIIGHFLTLLAMATTSIIGPFPYTTCHGYHQYHWPLSLHYLPWQPPVSLAPFPTLLAMATTSIIGPFPYITCHGYHQYHWPLSLHYLPWLPPVSLAHFPTLLAMVTTSLIGPFPYTTCHGYHQSHGLTVNVDIFALYIFSRNSRFLNIHENMHISKITFMLKTGLNGPWLHNIPVLRFYDKTVISMK